jgi:ATP-dependent DNA helicase 2 subunit 2
MAEKEATIYIVDVGKSMGERHHGRPITDLEWTMQYVWDKITATVRPQIIRYDGMLTKPGGYGSQDCKYWCNWTQNRWWVVGVIQIDYRLLTPGTLGTSNEQGEYDDNYSNISVLFELGQYVWSIYQPYLWHCKAKFHSGFSCLTFGNYGN